MNKIFIFGMALILILFSCKKIKFDYVADAKPAVSVYGTGSITLVLEAGMGNWSLYYKKLLPLLTPKYKVVLIDRAGYTNATVPNTSRDAKTLAIELNAALKEKDLLSDTIIIAGHSFGGLIAREYQNLYPTQVKGLILLDASHPQQFTQLPPKFNQLKLDQIEGMQATIKTAQRGFLKYKQGKKQIPTFNLPPDLLEDYYAITTNPQYYATFYGEVKNFDASLAHVSTLPSLGNLPLLILSSEKSMDETTLQNVKEFPFDEHNQKWIQLQNSFMQLSVNATYKSTNSANHYLPLFAPLWVATNIDTFINLRIR
jgi:pimeloyl-ACP methyl ester carboxylesterase